MIKITMSKLDTLCYINKFKYNKSIFNDINKEEVINRSKILKQYIKKLENLSKIPLVEQKTDEWYNMRQNLITASDFAQALGKGKFGTVKQFYQKKCEPECADSNVAGMVNPLFKWGNMFEFVAISIYTKMFKVKVNEFGLLKHPNYNFFGASPDGITDLGIMVEIKCPKNRKINGEVPEQYYYQIQGQLDVCDLDECDYFECDFKLSENYEEFLNNYENHKYKGIIIETEEGKYIYNSLDINKEELIEWLNNNNNSNIKKIHYWYLNNFYIKRIFRDKIFIEENMKKLKDIWNNVLTYRKDNTKYIMEVKKEIFIETQKYKGSKISGWAFLDTE